MIRGDVDLDDDDCCTDTAGKKAGWEMRTSGAREVDGGACWMSGGGGWAGYWPGMMNLESNVEET